MDGHDFADVDLLRRQRMRNALCNKQAQAVFVEMLQLASAA
jgi:hypothetical protein